MSVFVPSLQALNDCWTGVDGRLFGGRHLCCLCLGEDGKMKLEMRESLDQTNSGGVSSTFQIGGRSCHFELPPIRGMIEYLADCP